MAENVQSEDKSQIKVLIDLSDDPNHNNNIDVRGNQGVIIDILVQVFEHPDSECLAELFDLAVNEFYQKHPEKRIIN